jgi:outer membrane murein-binding lipoprotein Lpp
MAGGYDEKFDELTTIVKRVAGRVDEMQLELRDMRQDFMGMRDDLKTANNRLGSVESKVDLISRQFNDVGSMAIKDSQRITEIEKRVDVLEGDVH